MMFAGLEGTTEHDELFRHLTEPSLLSLVCVSLKSMSEYRLI